MMAGDAFTVNTLGERLKGFYWQKVKLTIKTVTSYGAGEGRATETVDRPIDVGASVRTNSINRWFGVPEYVAVWASR